ncbi:unnamed protein product [Linum trigynum]|uniref:Uncharacterized protein n=1 Tax=Linum trigynum TaxID=586398 RepID=A0AAV2EF35_9ROSI
MFPAFRLPCFLLPLSGGRKLRAILVSKVSVVWTFDNFKNALFQNFGTLFVSSLYLMSPPFGKMLSAVSDELAEKS